MNEVERPDLGISTGVKVLDDIIWDIIQMFKNKNSDYSDGSVWYNNFKESARQVGVTPQTSAEILLATKQSRLRSLQINSKEAVTDAIEDTLLDRAVYAIISYGIYIEERDLF